MSKSIYESPLYKGRVNDYMIDNFPQKWRYIEQNMIRGEMIIRGRRRTHEEVMNGSEREMYERKNDEIFVWHPEYPNQYCASQYGTVLSHDRDNLFHQIGWAKQGKSKVYQMVCLYSKDGKKNYYVHQMIAEIFGSEWYTPTADSEDNIQDHHANADSTDNSWINILRLPQPYHYIYEIVQKIEWKVGCRFYELPLNKFLQWNHDTHPLKIPNEIHHASLEDIAESLRKAYASGENPALITDFAGIYRVTFRNKKKSKKQQVS